MEYALVDGLTPALPVIVQLDGPQVLAQPWCNGGLVMSGRTES